MHIHICKGQHEDVDLLGKLYDELNDYLESHINYPGWKKGVYPTRSNALYFYQRSSLYVVKSGDRVVGSIALTHEPESSYENATWLIEASYDQLFVIHLFAVHPDWFRQGVGSALLQFSETQASIQNIKSIRLDVYEKNYVAIQAYEKQGYTYIDKVDIGASCYGLDLFCLYEKLIL